MAIVLGSRVGPYEVTALLGEGGMGKVWRAHHTGLKRDDALKVLPDAFASDPERLARFRREAQVLASLNHPNIAHVYGLEQSDGVQALVMELVEGPTLADRIAQGPVPLDEALPIAKQIAEALEAAHEHGIIHRDLKPANIKVRPDGTVKVLDFGLAKALEPMSARADATASPTITSPAMMTGVGMLLGTAAYMSPEQARGRAVDKRSDIWAFGCVLYEMLTGQRAFDGDDMTEVLAAIIKNEPNWAALPADVPFAVRALLQRCVTKDRLKRVSDIAAAKFVFNELGGINTPPVSVTAAGAPRARRRVLVTAVGAAAVTAIMVGAGAWALRPTPRPPLVAHFSFTLPEGQAFTGMTRQVVAISPDGARMAYIANARLYIRSLDDLEAHVVPGTDIGALNLLNPVFAPDGQSIAFWDVGSGTAGSPVTLMRVPVAGGAALEIAHTDAPYGASWSRDGILVGQAAGGIVRVSPSGGAPDRIVSVARDEQAHGPQMLPDGRTLLFTLTTGTNDDRWDKGQIVAQSLADGRRHVLISGGSDARYLSSGHLLYANGGRVLAVPFDAATLAIKGSPVPVVVGVRRTIGLVTATAHFALSESGTLAYLPGSPTATPTARGLAVGDGRGDVMPLKIAAGDYDHPRVSPDGKALAVGRNDRQQTDIWTYDLSGQTEIRRLTFGGNNRFPVWSGDGRHVTFQSARGGDRAIYWQLADGAGAAERLTKPGEGEEHVPESWSPDGRHLLFSAIKGTTYSLRVFDLTERKDDPFGTVQSVQPLGAAFSPDGRWVAYSFTDREGGLRSPNRGIFVEPFPATGEKHQAPKTLLDFHPVWTRDGKGILYIPSSTSNTVMLPVTTRPSVAFGTPVELPRAPRPGQISGDVRGYDVLPDGRIVSVMTVANDGQSTTEIRVVLNWDQELKRLAPTR